jgi:hypothetical protein
LQQEVELSMRTCQGLLKVDLNWTAKKIYTLD